MPVIVVFFFSFKSHSHLTSTQISDSNCQSLDSKHLSLASEGQEAAWSDAKDLELGGHTGCSNPSSTIY